MDHDMYTHSSAIDDFRRARQQAVLKEIMARITGQPVDLLSYDEVRQKLKAQNVVNRGVQDIPLDSIVGSVNRYRDFTRDFLPRHSVGAHRWANVQIASLSEAGVPPIEVYKIGEAYFVKDGNHRVSVARQLGANLIQAYVEEVQTPVPFSPSVTPDDIILKSEYAGFLERTHLGQIRPGVDLSVTAPGQYAVLEEHIAVHRYYMGIDLQRYIPFEEAVAHWYDTVYSPIIQIIQRTGILRDFPGRTEADLYLWVTEYRSTLEDELGREIRPEAAARDFADQYSPTIARVVSRISGKILTTIIPDNFETGPSTGEWRKGKMASSTDQRLFSDVLVAINGREDGWYALEQAFEISQRESANLHGLHVVDNPKAIDSAPTQAIQAEFTRRCNEAGFQGKLALDVGDVAAQISEQARWSDLVIVNLTFPPGPQPLAALSSGFRKLLQRCPRPVLAVPQVVSRLKRILLAYDGSSRSREALFISTYMAGQWKIPLVVISVLENGRVTSETKDEAKVYLEAHDTQALYVEKEGPAIQAILTTIEEHDCDLLLMGGYSHIPVLDVVLGSTVDRVLRESHKPMLICR